MKRASIISQSLLSASVVISAIALIPQAVTAETVEGSSVPAPVSPAVVSPGQPALRLEPIAPPAIENSADSATSYTANDLLVSPSTAASLATTGDAATGDAANPVRTQSATSSADRPATTTNAPNILPTTAASVVPGTRPIEFQLAQESEPLLTETQETRYRLGYIGVGANLGLTGDGALSDEGFAVFSKIPLTSNLSLRPALLFTDDVGVLVPVTYDFQIGNSDLPRALPYVGTGISISTGDDSEVDFLLTGGVDIPLSRQFTATAGLNMAPFNSFDLGILLGVAYNFEARAVRTPVVSVNADSLAQGARSNPSFLGAGMNLGIGGDSALGDSSFAVLSKIAVGPTLSVRPTLLIENDVTFLIPVTYDFAPVTTEYLTLAPYLGGGLSFSTGDDSNADLLLSAGFDVPITRNLAATTGINITPFDSFDIGIQAGLVLTFGNY